MFPVLDGLTRLRNLRPGPSFTTVNLQFVLPVVGARMRGCLSRHCFAARREVSGIPFDLSFATIALETPICSPISLKLGDGIVVGWQRRLKCQPRLAVSRSP